MDAPNAAATKPNGTIQPLRPPHQSPQQLAKTSIDEKPLVIGKAALRLRVFVPEADNHGLPFTPADYTRFEALVLDLTGGITERGPARGLWRHNGTTFSDSHREYHIIISHADAQKIAAAIVDYVRSAFRQHAVYVEITSVHITGF